MNGRCGGPDRPRDANYEQTQLHICQELNKADECTDANAPGATTDAETLG